MKLQPPPLNIYTRYVKLKTMAERGTVHESAEARNKLATLEKKYAFTERPPQAENEDDLFARAFQIKPDDRILHSVRKFEGGHSEVAAFAKWALLNAFNIEGLWKFGQGSTMDLCIGAKKADLPVLKHIVGVVVESFPRLWDRLRSSAGAPLEEENLFYRGLYDGMMRDPRKSGESIPKPALPKKKRAKGRKSASSRAAAATGKSAQSDVRPHAYEIAVSLGEQIRLSQPLEDVTASLDQMLRVSDRDEF